MSFDISPMHLSKLVLNSFSKTDGVLNCSLWGNSCVALNLTCAVSAVGFS